MNAKRELRNLQNSRIRYLINKGSQRCYNEYNAAATVLEGRIKEILKQGCIRIRMSKHDNHSVYEINQEGWHGLETENVSRCKFITTENCFGGCELSLAVSIESIEL